MIYKLSEKKHLGEEKMEKRENCIIVEAVHTHTHTHVIL